MDVWIVWKERTAIRAVNVAAANDVVFSLLLFEKERSVARRSRQIKPSSRHGFDRAGFGFYFSFIVRYHSC
jgi:hypothetical protein